MLALLLAATLAAAGPAPQDPARDALRERLAPELDGPAGFRLVETGPLFFLTQVHERRFVADLERRVALMQEVLEQDLPLELAEGEDPPAPVVVHVFARKDAYEGAGGPEGSVNYVDADGQRFLIHDPLPTARRDFWRALAGLQLKAHWMRAVGLPWPHAWMLHGHEDYYAGFELRAGRLVRKPNPLRLDTARQLVRDRSFVPLAEFLRWSGREYDDGSYFQSHYAQGWSVVWFLRTLPDERPMPEGWDPAWARILPRYVDGVRTTGDRDLALDVALKGVDLPALAAAWLESLD